MINNIIIDDIRFKSVKGGYIHIHKRSNNSGVKKPVVVFSHGFITDGLENHRMFLRIAKNLNNAGYSVVLYDNFGCGYSDGEYKDFRFSFAIKDYANVVNWAINNTNCNGKCVLFGQSLGTAVIIASIAYIKNEINSIILWNFSADIEKRYPKIFGDQIKHSNSYCIEHKGFYISSEFYNDVIKYDIFRYLPYVNSPILFLNSGNDNIGDMSLSDKAIKLVKSNKLRIVIEGANHSFNCQIDKEDLAIEKSVNWIEKHL